MIDHRHFASQELGGQIGPLHNAGGHALVFVLQVQPQLQRFDVFRRVKVYFFAVGAHQAHAVGAVLQGEAGESPLGGTGVKRNAYAVTVFVSKLLGVFHHFIPVLGRGFGIESNLGKGVLVVEHDHGGTLEGDGVDAAVHVGIQHESIDEVVYKRLSLGVGCDEVVQRHGHFGIGHSEALGGQAHKQVRRIAALNGGLNGRYGIIIVAGIYGLHLNIGVFRIKVCGHLVDEFGCISANVDGKVHRKLQGLLS